MINFRLEGKDFAIPLSELNRPIQLGSSLSSYLVRIQKTSPFYEIEAACSQKPFQLRSIAPGKFPESSWVRCTTDAESWKISLFFPSSQFKASSASLKRAEVGWTVIHPLLAEFKISTQSALLGKSPIGLHSFPIIDQQKRKLEMEIAWNPPVHPAPLASSRVAPQPLPPPVIFTAARPSASKLTQKWNFAVSSQISQLNYNEPTQPISISQIAATAKADARFQPNTPRWDFGAYGFITALPISTAAPTGTPAPRFYGAGVRAGYALNNAEKSPESLRKSISMGAYFWGMIVGSQTYGVASLAGPQWVFNLGSAPASSRIWNTYLKYAMIFDAPRLPNLQNIEVATGASYRFPRFDLTWDLAYTQAQATGVVEVKMSLLSNTLGFRFALR